MLNQTKIMVCAFNQHSTAWWSDGNLVMTPSKTPSYTDLLVMTEAGTDLSAESPVPPVNTVPHGGQMESLC